MTGAYTNRYTTRDPTYMPISLILYFNDERILPPNTIDPDASSKLISSSAQSNSITVVAMDKRESTAMQHVISVEPDRGNAPIVLAVIHKIRITPIGLFNAYPLPLS
ncbi:uncharacterized protein BT62DRAFT_1013381 [Guyanagaster necrorhizus]|uniref:Uncharacterized protein n=1 Tax=Guyanagaster necrorhizus TaxID=856835 RepID=A0A9P7VGU4_9AGAR|nr:uncharacterized protein BT62DRAFT_1013381 [Guyanagaster necrorhizus MCA 3950]KAG7439841.1 hypothetical protein BT62DRAFT_1013381 [Guyanagaster necrorhizus MCA 3950]